MRILYHHRTLGDGAEGIHIREMVSAFRRLGHDVKVIGPTGEATGTASKRGRALGALKRRLPIFFFEFIEVLYSALAFVTVLKECILSRPTFIYDRYIAFNVGPVLAGLFARVPVCLEVNAPLALERAGEQDERLCLRSVAAVMERWICTLATVTVVVSSPLRTYLESVGVPKGKCVVMPNGVDPMRFAPRESLNETRIAVGAVEGQFIVGFTGVLRPWHGLDLLVRAFAGMRGSGLNAFLLIVGDGPYRGTVEKMLADLEVDQQSHITGRISHDQVPDMLALCDVAVSPRATFYASPMKVMEYMALGKAVVVPHTPNFLDFIDEGTNGVTFEEESAASLEEALSELYRAPARCVELGAKARRKVEERLNWTWNAERVVGMLGK